MQKDVDAFIEALRRGDGLPPYACQMICTQLQYVLMREPNVVPLAPPITVVGDVHGQFNDLIHLFNVGGQVPGTKYLFLGDYVDRGESSVLTISLLAALKYLIRGNHESRAVTSVYGFQQECLARYGSDGELVWRVFTDSFDYLPIGALLNNSIFCLHGGLSPAIHTIDQIRALERFQEVPHDGPLADLYWSDPEAKVKGFALSNRGVGYLFGQDVFDMFTELNGVSHMLRAHQLCMEGYLRMFDDRLTTVWSAPNYCYRAGNKASIAEISESLDMHFNVFDACANEARVIAETSMEKTGPDYFM